MSDQQSVQELQTRARMLPWLESRINSGEIAGLEWLDRDSKTFKVPWKNVGSRDWCEADGQIFKEWAIYKGKYREHVDQEDFPTWKTRFRTALTKLPDISELRHLNRLDQQTTEPYRVYRFLPRNSPIEELHVTAITPMTSNNPQPHVTPVNQTTLNIDQSIPTTAASGAVSLDGIPSDDILHLSNDIDITDHIESIDTGDVNIAHCDVENNQEEGMETVEGIPNTGAEMAASDNRQIPAIANEPASGQNDATQRDIQNSSFDHHDTTLRLTVKYAQNIVLEKAVNNAAGCHIYYDLAVKLSREDEYLKQVMFGPSEASQISLPECHSMNSEQDHLTSKLLRALDRGLLLRMYSGNIIATRKCRCNIFVSTPSLNDGQLTKLIRDQPTVVFDLNNYFTPALNKYLYRQGPKPVAELVLSFGQRFQDSNESLNNLLISAKVEHAAARSLLTRISCTSPISPPIEISNSDNIDRILDVIHFSTQNTGFDTQTQTAFA